MQVWLGRRHRDAKAGWLDRWFRPSLQKLETRRVLSATSYLHPDGTAFQVADSQQGAAVAADANGNTIVTWEAVPSGSTNVAVYAQRFNDQGQALDSAFVVAGPLASGSVQSVGAVADASGDFAVVWYATSANRASSLEVQRYNSQGQAQGSIMPLPGNTRSGDQFAMNAQEDLLVVYQSNTSLFGQRYDTQNNLIGTAIQINPTVPAAGFQLATDSAGDFMVAWAEESSSTGPVSIYARGYDNQAMPQGNEFLVVSSSDTTSAATANGLGIAGYGSGDFLIQWQNRTASSTSLLAERFDVQGTPLDGQFQIATAANIAELYPSAAAAPDGSFLEVGLPADPGTDASGLFAEHFAPWMLPWGLPSAFRRSESTLPAVAKFPAYSRLARGITW